METAGALVVGTVRQVIRYPVKSMAGESVAAAPVWWHGLLGDRHYAFVRTGDRSHFPWLTARQVPALLQYVPSYADPADPNAAVLVRTPDGHILPLEDPALCARLAAAHGAPVHLMQLDRGAFDSMPLSVTSSASLADLGSRVGTALDARRFRQNVIVETHDGRPYAEDAWVGGLLILGEGDDRVRVRLARRIPRCMMVNLDPDTSVQDPRVLREVVRERDTCSGVYGSIDRVGTLRVGDVVRLVRDDAERVPQE